MRIHHSLPHSSPLNCFVICRDLKIRESPQKGVWIEGLNEEFVSCEEDILGALISPKHCISLD